jgi:peptidyl-prolyl cis-trans isomerase SurA
VKVNEFLRRGALIFAALFVFCGFSAIAQESEPVVVDEVIAQVNDGIITLSSVKRAQRQAVESLVQQGNQTPEAAEREIQSRRSQLIANLINEELLLQQSKEMNLENEVEAQVNARFDAIRKQQNLRTLEELYKQMREQGLDPDDIKATLRREISKQMVINYGVGSKIYNSLTDKELRAYFETHADKFKKPEVVSLSEIYLSFAGRKTEDVKKEAAEIVKKARAGTDFTQLVTQYSDRADSKAKKGAVGKFGVNELNEEISNALKNLRVGSVTEPIVQEDGILILRVDERSADASSAPVYDERRVREMITTERLPAERKKYMANLRRDAYIKIADNYKTEVSKELNKDDDKN